jgi:diguanylate cyclase (GGDEF)-like protein
LDPIPLDRARGSAGPAAPVTRAARFRSPAGTAACCLAIIACVGVADYFTGTEIELILFYLAPIGFGAWFVGVGGGAALSVVGAAVSVTADALHQLHGGGSLRPGVLVWNAGMELGTAISVVVVLAALRDRLQAQEVLARTDALTHISNRRAFFEAALLEIERSRRTGRPLALAYVDCDDFKNVNDLLGHAQGDALLRTAAQTLRGATRAVDAVARLGGDEFGLLLPETSAHEAEVLLGRVHGVLLSAMAWHGWKVGFSIGAAVFVTPPESADEIMARADELMYAAKREAKGSIRIGVYGAGRREDRTATPQ